MVHQLPHPKQRISSIDFVRGLIMIIMALDHTRDFLHYPVSPTNMQTTTGILFFTRWITHFCAPTFVFLSGVSVFLSSQRKSKKELSIFLLKRGLWLVLSDLLIISLLFTFDPLYHILVLEVLWVTGFSMILLSFLVYIPLQATATIALVIIFGHDLLNYADLPQTGFAGTATTLMLKAFGAMIPIGEQRTLACLYAAIPWAGAGLLGYVFGSLYSGNYDATKRRKILASCGLAFIAIFIVLRLVNHYGDPRPWRVQADALHTFLSFLNTTKQVPSLLFFAMTLGPMMLLLSMSEKSSNRFTKICQVYGATPYFYFILHFCLLRAINILLILAEGLPMHASTQLPLVWQADNFGHPLWFVYVSWIGVVALFYYPCKWYGKYKRTHNHWWLSYV